MSNASTVIEARLSALTSERDGILAIADPAEFTPEKQARELELSTEIRGLRARKAELADEEQRAVIDAAARPAVQVVSEANPVYRKGDPSASYFADLVSAPTDASARDRLVRSQETRSLTTVAGAGGEMAPPLWLVEDFVKLARAGRVTADLMNKQALPAGVSSVNVPAISGGTSVGVTQTQNTAVSNTDITTTSLSSDITTISGQQVVSIQLLRQSGIPLDSIILGDLALAYATQLDLQVVSGSGANGQLKGLTTAGTTVTFTTTTPAVVSSTAAASFYNKIISAKAAVQTGRFLPADAIIMTPTRWGWIQEALDTTNRPVLNTNGASFNSLATYDGEVAEGYAGMLAGLPVYLDPSIPANLGVATNQDSVFVLRRGDNVLWETPVESATFEATYAQNNSVLFRVLGFSAFIARYAKSVQVIGGTGLVVPTL